MVDRVGDLTEREWLVVHDVRLRGLAELGDSYDLTVVETLVAADVVKVKGRFLALTPQGRVVHAEWARVAEGSAAHDALVRFYTGFGELNHELLQICTAWQVLPSGAANDHRDRAYDWKVIDRVSRLHERTAPRVLRVARDVERFGWHARRLRRAHRELVDEGNGEWLTGTTVDSYHTVWNQLHEDLLLALGRDRAEEPMR
jgi:hypothetical protein